MARALQSLRDCVPGSGRLDKASLIEAAIAHINALRGKVVALEQQLGQGPRPGTPLWTGGVAQRQPMSQFPDQVLGFGRVQYHAVPGQVPDQVAGHVPGQVGALGDLPPQMPGGLSARVQPGQPPLGVGVTMGGPPAGRDGAGALPMMQPAQSLFVPYNPHQGGLVDAMTLRAEAGGGGEGAARRGHPPP